MAQNSLSVAMVADIEGEGAISQSQPHKTLGILDEMLLGAQIKIDPAVKPTLFYFSSSEEHVFAAPAGCQMNQYNFRCQPTAAAAPRALCFGKGHCSYQTGQS